MVPEEIRQCVDESFGRFVNMDALQADQKRGLNRPSSRVSSNLGSTWKTVGEDILH